MLDIGPGAHVDIPWIAIGLVVVVFVIAGRVYFLRLQRSVNTEPFAERAKLRIDLYKVSLETITLVGVASSALFAVLTYLQQTEKTVQELSADRRKQNSEQFLVAINLLKEGTLSSTVGAIVVLKGVVRNDVASFRIPARNILQTALYEMQVNPKSPEELLTLSSGIGMERYQRLLSAYVETHARVDPARATTDTEYVDMRFLRVAGLVLPDVKGYALDLTGATLPKADFSHLTVTGIFDKADLTDAKFQQADLRGSRFKQTRLRNATFIGSDLSRVDMTGADLRNANLESVKSMQCANLRAVDGENAQVVLQSLIEAKIYPETQRLGLVSYEQIVKRREETHFRLDCD